MTLNALYNMIESNTGIKIYINSAMTHYCADKKEIPIALFKYDIVSIGNDSDGLKVNLNVPYVSYEDLDVYAKLNAVNGYVNVICSYDDFTEAHDLQELENWCIAFLENSEYNLDKDGNWYDEDYNCITEIILMNRR